MKIGVCGGTFDPIHMGHMIMGEEACDILGLQSILYIPAKIPPHKRGISITPAEHRLAMVKLAVQDNRKFCASDLELMREGPSYTVQTLEYLRDSNPCDEFYFIMGQDAFLEIETWHRFQDVFDLCRLVIVTRPGSPEVAVEHFGAIVRNLIVNDSVLLKDNWEAGRFLLQKAWRMCFLPIPALHVSSSEIRRRIREGRSIQYMVPATVRDYIVDNNLYKEKKPGVVNEYSADER
ncbi:MAG: nicotinate-nucleotide adenylyltransferase [bacterium]